jgi:hypothetical protein
MAWSDNRFSDQYSAAKKSIKDGTFDKKAKKLVDALTRLMTDTGFDDGQASKLKDLRKQVGSKKSTEDKEILALIGSDTLDVSTRERAAAIKFLRHIYLLKKAGSHKVWVHSLPNDFGDWAHYALKAATGDAAKTLLRSDNERFSEEDKKNLSNATQHGVKWVQKTLIHLANAAKKGDSSKKKAGLELVKRWFADEDTTDTDLEGYVGTLQSGFKAIESTLKGKRLIFTDFPTLRNATNPAEQGFLNSEAFVWPKGGREKLDVVYVESAFFGTNNVLTGQANWTRIVIHELSHLVVGTKDIQPGPRYAWYGILPYKGGFTAAQAMDNAESWAFFSADCAGALSDSERNRALTKK